LTNLQRLWFKCNCICYNINVISIYTLNIMPFILRLRTIYYGILF
jgi:hypothetical protein